MDSIKSLKVKSVEFQDYSDNRHISYKTFDKNGESVCKRVKSIHTTDGEIINERELFSLLCRHKSIVLKDCNSKRLFTLLSGRSLIIYDEPATLYM